MATRHQIRTPRLRLRPLRLDDLGDLYRLWVDHGVRRYLWDDRVISRDRARAEIERSIGSFERSGFGQWAVFRFRGRQLIGFCGLRYVGAMPEVELLYGLAPSCWGQGLATEAVRAVLVWGFTKCRLKRIVACADQYNAASCRVMAKAGMKFEKRTRVNDAELLHYAVSRGAFRPG